MMTMVVTSYGLSNLVRWKETSQASRCSGISYGGAVQKLSEVWFGCDAAISSAVIRIQKHDKATAYVQRRLADSRRSSLWKRPEVSDRGPMNVFSELSCAQSLNLGSQMSR